MTTHGFELLRDEMIPEIASRARLYRHTRTGAELLSMENADENKTFGITFRTPPPDSTGIAHIMEHSVLCGSRKYPVKEPFVELMKGSLQTFLNARTYPDKTVYPVASQNVQDFYNLIDVYLDSVLYPRLEEHTLRQEGWHYELAGEDEEQPALAYKGVVFNEMKGAYSAPDGLLDKYSLASLFPDNIYGLDSGGDPAVIPDLTYDSFQRFHRTYYHPSNARIFFWGDDDPEKRLEILDEWLRDFEAIEPQSEIGLQPRFTSARRVEETYDPGEDAEQAKAFVTVNWMLTEGGDPEETFALSVLNHMLIGTPASPLRKALIDSGLGEDLAGGGLETGLRQFTFSTGLKGVQLENVDAVERLVLDTLTGLSRHGFDPDTLAASLNTIEFHLREQNTGSFPRGLYNLINSLETWLYGGDPLALLAFEAPLQAVKAGSTRKGYFEDRIRRYWLENPHRTTVILRPDPEYAARTEAAEQARLAAERARMSAADLQSVLAETEELHRRQEAPDSPAALASIPVLRREDLEPQARNIPTEIEPAGQAKVLFHDLFTNGVFYLDLGFNLHRLPEQLLGYVPIFSRALLGAGAGDQSFVQVIQRIGRSTGGIRPSTLTSPVFGAERGEAWLFLRAKAMTGQVSELLAILQDILTGVRLDNRERIRQMALESKASMESSLTDAGHSYVNKRLRAHYTEADWAAEQMSGVDQLFFLRALVERIDREWETVQADLETARSLLLNQSAMLANVTIDRANWDALRPQVHQFLTTQMDYDTGPALWESGIRPGSEGLAVPSQVNFVGRAANLYAGGYEPQGAPLVILPALRAGYLWDRVRVQGGAYGAMAGFDRFSGVLTFLSYRDPNLANTLQVYAETADFLRSLDLSDAELTKAIIAAIGDLDSYQLPDAKGYTALTRYLLGVSDAERQRLRDQVLATTAADFRRFGEALAAAWQGDTVTVALGARAALEQAEGLTIRKVM
jgi:Zn-dependent M16 (insulinase) family peptidase